MKKIEAIIQPYKLEDVKNPPADIGIDGMTVTEVRGHGRQKGHSEVHRGQEYSADLLLKIKIELELVVHGFDCDSVLAAICRGARTGHTGDGKIFVHAVSEAIRIRNGQRNEAAL